MPKEFVQHSSDLGKDILYRPSLRVDDIKSQDIQNLITKMKNQMQGEGIGLAANQIGNPLQIFMIEYSSEVENPAHSDRYDVVMPAVPFQVFINPKIINVSKDLVSFWHGCLSAVDSNLGLVSTYKWIEYEAYNEKGEIISNRLDDFGAVIFQHEFRHLLGGLYIHKAKVFKAYDELEKLFKSGRLKAYDVAKDDTPHLLDDYHIGESIEEFSKRKK